MQYSTGWMHSLFMDYSPYRRPSDLDDHEIDNSQQGGDQIGQETARWCVISRMRSCLARNCFQQCLLQTRLEAARFQ